MQPSLCRLLWQSGRPAAHMRARYAWVDLQQHDHSMLDLYENLKSGSGMCRGICTCFLKAATQNSLQMNFMTSRGSPVLALLAVYRSASCLPTLNPAGSKAVHDIYQSTTANYCSHLLFPRARSWGERGWFCESLAPIASIAAAAGSLVWLW